MAEQVLPPIYDPTSETEDISPFIHETLREFVKTAQKVGKGIQIFRPTREFDHNAYAIYSVIMQLEGREPELLVLQESKGRESYERDYVNDHTVNILAMAEAVMKLYNPELPVPTLDDKDLRAKFITNTPLEAELDNYFATHAPLPGLPQVSDRYYISDIRNFEIGMKREQLLDEGRILYNPHFSLSERNLILVNRGGPFADLAIGLMRRGLNVAQVNDSANFQICRSMEEIAKGVIEKK